MNVFHPLVENVGLTLRARLKSLIIENDDNEAEVKKEVLVNRKMEYIKVIFDDSCTCWGT